MKRLGGGVLAGVLGLAGASVAAGAARRRARGIPFSPVTADWYVGPDFPERAGIVDDDAPTPAGEMDDLDAFARPDFDPGRVHPEIRAFYEETSAFSMTYQARWHRPFRTGAAFASRATSRIEQLNLPAPGDERSRKLESRFAPIDPAADPREGARAWVRTDPETGEAVFVALYAHHEGRSPSERASGGTASAEDGQKGSRVDERLVNIAVPLPGWNLSTILHLEALDTETEAGAGLRLTTRAAGDPGLYAVRDHGYWLPMDQTFTVWPADAPGAPAPPEIDADGDPDLVATHEMWLLGMQFLTVSYAIENAESPTR